MTNPLLPQPSEPTCRKCGHPASDSVHGLFSGGCLETEAGIYRYALTEMQAERDALRKALAVSGDDPLWAGRMRWMVAHSADFAYSHRMRGQITKRGDLHSIEDIGTTISVRVPLADEYGFEVYDAPTIAEAIDKAARETKHEPVVAYNAIRLSLPDSRGK